MPKFEVNDEYLRSLAGPYRFAKRLFGVYPEQLFEDTT